MASDYTPPHRGALRSLFIDVGARMTSRPARVVDHVIDHLRAKAAFEQDEETAAYYLFLVDGIDGNRLEALALAEECLSPAYSRSYGRRYS